MLQPQGKNATSKTNQHLKKTNTHPNLKLKYSQNYRIFEVKRDFATEASQKL